MICTSWDSWSLTGCWKKPTLKQLFKALFSLALYIDVAIIVYIKVKKWNIYFINLFLNLRSNSIIWDVKIKGKVVLYSHKYDYLSSCITWDQEICTEIMSHCVNKIEQVTRPTFPKWLLNALFFNIKYIYIYLNAAFIMPEKYRDSLGDGCTCLKRQ